MGSSLAHPAGAISGRNILVWLCVVFMLQFTNASSQNAGDYRSAISGNWTTLSSWQRYDGSSWLTPTAGQGYPGQFTGTGQVSISAGHTITIGSSGISTQPITKLTVANTATLYLNGGTSSIVTFYINTPTILVNSTTGTIFFNNKARLALPVNGIVYVGTGGLTGTCNNNVEIRIGSVTFANCSGAPGNIFTFAQLMAMGAGGTLGAIPAATAPGCAGGSISLTGNFTGAIGAAPTYSWSVTAPGGAVTNYATQNVSIPSAAGGTWTATLTVSTNLNGTIYTNAQTVTVYVNPLPTLSTLSQNGANCNGSAATISLSGLLPNTTFTLEYSIGGTAQTPLTGLTANGSGNASFITPVLYYADNGKTLQVTRITTTSTPGLCTSALSVSTTLSVWQDGSWLGNTSTDWSDAANWCGGVPTATTDVIIRPSSPHQPSVGMAGGICHNITILSGATLSISGSGTLNVRGDWISDGSFICGSGTVIMDGTMLQTIGGSSATTFGNLEIDNASGVNLTADATVEAGLTLTSGKLKLSGSILTSGTAYANGMITGGGSTNYICAYDNGISHGTLRCRINDKNDVTYFFPVGDNDDYSPFTFVLNAITSAVSGAFLDVYVKDARLTGLNPGISDYITRYWDVTPGGTFTDPNFDVFMQYTDSDVEGSEPAYYPVKTNGTDWYTCIENVNLPAIKTGNGGVVDLSNTLYWNGVTSFSRFSGAGGDINPLPVELISFEPLCDGENGPVEIRWITATETNNAFFTIERSTDALHWQVAGTVPGAGNSNTMLQYSFTDENAVDVSGQCIYYRLTQTDHNGHSETFGIAGTPACSRPGAQEAVTISPNPFVSGVRVIYGAVKPGVCNLRIRDSKGVVVYSGEMNTLAGDNILQMDLHWLPASVYLIEVSSAEGSEVKRVVKMKR